jgi:hypothetical protein
MTYDAWITQFEQRALDRVSNITDFPEAQRQRIALRGTCQWAVIEMVTAFPELRKVRGHYNGWPHWWCATPDGTIVDPTRKQFGDPGGDYVEYTGPDPIGKCMECGELVWTREQSGSSAACSRECLTALEAYYGAGGPL